MLPCRPAEYITASAAIFFPEASVVMVPKPELSTDATSSPKRKDIAWSRRWNLSDSTISGSQKSSICGRFSTRVTRVPSAANIEAYSTPITPAPTTTREFGNVLQLEDLVRVEDPLAVELDVARPGRNRPGGDHDLVRGQRAVHLLALDVDRQRVRVDELAIPGISSMWLRSSWDRITSVSRPTTCCSRASRSAIVISSLTR